MKKWEIISESGGDDIIRVLLQNRGLTKKNDIDIFLHPKNPFLLTPADVGIDEKQLAKAISRIKKAIKNKESIVVYADYDADGIAAGTIMWETLHSLGANVMPYIPHRVEEGYGLSQRGIDSIIESYHPTLIVTVDHGITGKDKIEYAKTLGIDVIVTDHHTKPDSLPDCIIIHTTQLCGAGVSWFVSKELTQKMNGEHIALAAIGTVADLVPLLGANRAVVKFGLQAINVTTRVGLNALLLESGSTKGEVRVYDISHVLAPRINAMGRLEHGMDALRLLCTNQEDRAMLLARKLSITNKERQQLTMDSSDHAKQSVVLTHPDGKLKKLLFIADVSYNQGIIGLVAGRLVEEYYLPSIVLAIGPDISKASARSITGFNIVEAIRGCSDLLLEVGGHPMAAGFTVLTKNLEALRQRLEHIAEDTIEDDVLKRSIKIDLDIPFESITEGLWNDIKNLEPFGFGNVEPVFSTHEVTVVDHRVVGKAGKHLKLKVRKGKITIDAIAFGLGSLVNELQPRVPVDIAYSIDMNTWNGRSSLQLKIKDIRVL